MSAAARNAAQAAGRAAGRAASKAEGHTRDAVLKKGAKRDPELYVRQPSSPLRTHVS